MENAIDFGHFAALHRLVVDISDPPRFEGRGWRRPTGSGGPPGSATACTPSVRTVVQGLGVMYGEAEKYGFWLRIWFCVTPVDPRHVRMCLTAAVRHTRPSRTGAARVVAALLPRAVTCASGLETDKNVPVWKHIAHLEHPGTGRSPGSAAGPASSTASRCEVVAVRGGRGRRGARGRPGQTSVQEGQVPR